MIDKSKRQGAEFTRWMGPLLDALRELGGSARPREASDRIATTLGLSETLLEATTKTGQDRFYNQVAWARQYLVWVLGWAEKGIFITTGRFSKEATAEASRDGAPPVELVDGETLVELFERAGLGVKPRTVFDVDFGFFEQFKS